MKENRALDRLRVSTPCREDWNLMPGGDRARFCSQCEKSVHDISRMTRSEAEALVAGSNGQLCVRFYREIDGSIRTEDEGAPPARLPHGSRLVNATLAGLLAFQVSTQAQVSGLPAPSSAIPVAREEKGAKPRQKPQVPRSSLSGTVGDTNKAAIVGAKIRIQNRSTGETNTVFSSEDGWFEFRNVDAGDYTLEADAQGFALSQNPLTLRPDAEIRLEASLSPVGETIGVVVSDGGIVEASPIPRELQNPIKAIRMVPERTSK